MTAGTTDNTGNIDSGYPGQRLGLPAAGVGSIARVGRRFGALAIDLATATIIAYAFFPMIDDVTGFRNANPLASNIIFLAVQVIFIPTVGGSPGHRLLGMRLVRLDGGWTGLWRPTVRTLLLALIIPAVVWDADQRGLHDKLAGTVLIRA
ncbi:RDD family protein [Microbacterium sp. VKM Ac-2870]|uniref:RDD family protein n=1 Tax=Microbacterium sp. VKM Ac-2870 TaxID=2783825 RepID=UPI00188D12B7|nr:RDD family protein [Microbacterium sp. VKM Ac-2870]MBF4560866.1 RDD family protein [Microbacterium sp. VKM Ac-2870]